MFGQIVGTSLRPSAPSSKHLVCQPPSQLPVLYKYEWCLGDTGVVSSIPPCVTCKAPLVRKATGNHLTNSTSLERT